MQSSQVNYESVALHFDPLRLERVFANCFAAAFNTRLCGGAPEPIYQPATDASTGHLLWYREDYFASALHEVAHWCIAGQARRRQVDFGYWYAPDGRSPEQQAAFEAVEDKPQTLEWYFSLACDYSFQLSADNLAAGNGGIPENAAFRRRVLRQALLWQRTGLPTRANQFYLALCREFDTRLSIAELCLREECLL